MAVSRTQLFAIAAAGSIALHVGIAASVASIRKAPVRRGPTSITVSAAKKKQEAKKQEKPPEPVVAKNEPAVAKRAAPPKAAPKAVEAKAPVVAAAAAPVAEFALTLSNGGGGGPGGIAVPTHAVAGPAPTTSAATPQPKVLVAKANVDECSDPPTKPKPLKVVQPAYTEKAREAQVEGRVRVEILVDENGNVANAKVLAGLGHGLDEAALQAARGSTFAAATRCGKPISSTFVIGMRFNL